MKSWQTVIISWSHFMSTVGLITKTPRSMQGRLPIHTYDIPNYHTRVPVCSNHFLKQSFLVQWACNEETALRWDCVGASGDSFHPFQCLSLLAMDFVVDCSTGHTNARMHAEALRCTHMHSYAAPQRFIFDGNLHFFLPSIFIVVLSHWVWTQPLKGPSFWAQHAACK